MFLFLQSGFLQTFLSYCLYSNANTIAFNRRIWKAIFASRECDQINTNNKNNNNNNTKSSQFIEHVCFSMAIGDTRRYCLQYMRFLLLLKLIVGYILFNICWMLAAFLFYYVFLNYPHKLYIVEQKTFISCSSLS